MSQDPEKWTTQGLLDHILRIDETMPDRSFAFILGAGASVASGIPAGGTLVEKWLGELQKRFSSAHSNPSLQEWATAENLGIKGFEWDRAAAFYPKVFERRFGNDAEEGYAYLETVMDGKEPSFGYSVLAQILARTRHRVVVTTNFDHLVADALGIYTQVHPVVAGHESLTGFVRPRLRRPLIAKIHRDLYFAPKNNEAGVECLAGGWEKSLEELFSHYTPIVLGYGGNDGSLMGFLEKLQEKRPIPGGIFWCYRADDGLPGKEIQKVVAGHHGALVPIVGFDEFMLQLGDVFSLGFLDGEIEARARKQVERYRDQVTAIQKRLRDATENEGGKADVRKALDATMKRQGNWWKWYLKADEEPDPEKREYIYREGLEEIPESPELLGAFAVFLHKNRKKYAEAERLYRKALALDPEHVNNTGNFANFMTGMRKGHDEAERLFLKALALDPKNARNTGNFAFFMTNIRKDHEKAEHLFRKALALDPENAIHTGNFACFMTNIRKDYGEAERLFRKALALDPENTTHTGNFANFMTDMRKDHDEAERLYRKALALDPENAVITGYFANFMTGVRKDYDEAERLFRKALALDPEDATVTGNFALFMTNIRKDHDEAEHLYRKAMELDPEDATLTGSFACFMMDVRKDYGEAELLLQNALAVDPENMHLLANYSELLLLKDSESFQETAVKALSLYPKREVAYFAVLLFLLEINAIMKKKSNPMILGRLKALLLEGFEGADWNFPSVLFLVKPHVPAKTYGFYVALADVINNTENVKNLAGFSEWEKISPVPPETPWEETAA